MTGRPVPMRRRTTVEQIVYAWGRLSPQLHQALERGEPLASGEPLALALALDRAIDELARRVCSCGAELPHTCGHCHDDPPGGHVCPRCGRGSS